jgi:chemotaxis protein methyltransferase CheR
VADPAEVTEEEFRRLAEFLYRRTGMVFTESKRYFVERRLSDRMSATARVRFSDYFAYLRSEAQDEVEHLINAFTINETY